MIQITCENSTALLAHCSNICDHSVYWKEYEENFVMSFCVLYWVLVGRRKQETDRNQQNNYIFIYVRL
jgi:hypothetical protein